MTQLWFSGGKNRTLITLVLVFVLGAGCGISLQAIIQSMRTCVHFDLLNPRLPCDGVIEDEWDFEPLRDLLVAKKAELQDAKKITQLSIYFRDISPGPRFGVGEYDKFHPASLSKVPIMIALLHEADRDPTLLNKTLMYTGALATNMNVEAADQTIEPNTPYTIRELIEKMIVYSDNYSYIVLTRELNDPSPIGAYYTFRDLDVLSMMLAPKADVVSIQSYGNLFAILYGNGYLSREMSQFALGLLSKSTYQAGLVAGVPENVRVAHKFGLRKTNDEIQLHDCGIVYYEQPYILCVMTSGTDQTVLESVISDISKTVYDHIAARAEGQ